MLNSIKFFLNSSAIINIYRFLKGGRLILSRDKLNLRHLNKINLKDTLFNLQGINFQEIENKEIDDKIPSVFGWVPFKKNKTNLVIYDFFATNYSVRKQKLLRISLISQNKIISQKLFLFPGFTIIDLNLNEIFSDLDGEYVCVELFHPFIRQNHGGADGQFRFWVRFHNGNSLDNLSTSHSLILRKGIKCELKEMTGRRFNSTFDGFEHKDYSMHPVVNTFEKGQKVKTFFGFNTIEDNNQNIKSLTHHSYFLKKNKNAKFKRYRQCLYIPKIKDIDPIVFIDNIETGVEQNDISIIIFDKKNREVCRKDFISNGFFSSSISSIYKLNSNEDYFSVIEFNALSQVYAHVQYKFNVNNLCDQVHLHHSNWEIENNILIPTVKTLGSSRKFGYILKRKNLSQNDFFNLYVDVSKKIQSINFSLRLYTDMDYEEVKILNFNAYNPILNINLRDVFLDLDSKFSKVAIVQLESKTEIINGSFLRIDLENKLISTDHLTGG